MLQSFLYYRTAEDSCQGGRRRREHNIRDAIIVEGITSLIDSRKWYEHSVLDCLRHILIPSINSPRTWLQLMMRWWKDTHIAARPVHIDSYSVHAWLKCVYPCDCIGACVSHLQSFLYDMKLHYLLLLPYSDSFSQGAHYSYTFSSPSSAGSSRLQSYLRSDPQKTESLIHIPVPVSRLLHPYSYCSFMRVDNDGDD